MGSEEEQDWIDRVMAREVWEPPPDFAAHVAARAMALRPGRTRLPGFQGLVRVSIAGFVHSALAHIEGYVWTLRQLSHLMRGGHRALR